MTNKEKLFNFIRNHKDCKKELMALTFGCEVEYQMGDWYGERGYVTMECGKCTKHKLHKSCNMDCEYVDAVEVIDIKLEEPSTWVLEQNHEPPFYKVIGHEPEWRHLMKVIDGKWSQINQPYSGTIEIVTHSGKVIEYKEFEPLSNQPPQTYKALVELLNI